LYPYSYSRSTKTQPQPGQTVLSVLKIVSGFMMLVITAFCAVYFLAMQVPVTSSSMSPALSSGETVLSSSAVYSFTAPQRLDICAFRVNGRVYVKRIIGLPGETVRITDGRVYINDVELEGDVTDQKAISPGLASDGITLGDDEYFVLGDNRNNSEDSRSISIGTVKRSQIIGKCWCRLTSLGPYLM
jgi:signal peptidase I